MGDQHKKYQQRQRAATRQANLARERALRTARSKQQLQASLRADLSKQAAFAQDPEAYQRRFGVSPRFQTPRRSWQKGGSPEAGTYVDKSSIHGQGVFTGEGIQAGNTMFPTHQGSDLTYTAGMINASKSPNVMVQVLGGQQMVTALQDINPGQELVADYPVPDSGVWHGTDVE